MTRLHPYTAVRDALAYGIQTAAIGFFLGATSSGVVDFPVRLVFVLAPLGFVVGAGYGVARYRAFEYDLGESTLHIASGVIARQNREIPLRRIQNVDVQQTFVQRLFGLAVVRFETAGGGETEATLRLVSRTEADALQSELRRLKRDRASTADEGEVPATAERGGRDTTGRNATGRAAARSTVGATPIERSADRELLFELSLGDLLVLSGVTFRWGVLPLLLFALPLADTIVLRIGERLVRTVATDGELSMFDPLTIVLAAAGVVSLLVVSWLVSGAITFVRYYGFQLGRIDGELVYERGLLQRYSGSIPLEKVQSLTVKENVLMRRFGYAALTVETAGYSASGNQSGAQRTPSAIPLAERTAVLALAADLEGVDDIAVDRPPRRARRRYAGRYAIVVGLATAVLFAVHRFVWPMGVAWAIPLAGLPLVPLAAHLKWANRGHRLGDDHFVARTGFVRRTTNVVPYYRVQNVVTERTVFQRRWDIASVVADTASSSSLGNRDATAHDVDDGEADALHHELRTRLRTDVARRRDERRQRRARRLLGGAEPAVEGLAELDAEKPADRPADRPAERQAEGAPEPSDEQSTKQNSESPDGEHESENEHE